jgi:hypothetical protein
MRQGQLLAALAVNDWRALMDEKGFKSYLCCDGTTRQYHDGKAPKGVVQVSKVSKQTVKQGTKQVTPKNK